MNGPADNGSSRLDRIERALERLAVAQEEQRREFDRELKALLTAQVVLTDRVDKISEHMGSLALAQAETTDKLNALITLMDRHLKEGHH